jgi:ABC-type polysaccharide/polyol phosphate transport system ATPase subunit
VQGAPPPNIAVRADGLTKAFRLPHERAHTLKQRVLHPRRWRSFDVLTALHDVSFDVERGECFGIVGRNGSGKSTLMKCLAGVYRADAGEMWVRGRLAPFIELGVGFRPELTAEDNVLLNAIMLGLTPAEARARYDDIIAFAELEEFVDLKLKNYSSGMQVRLAFAVMVHVDADVLLIDEVLAVGDAAFQQKCYEALGDARNRGQTILLVSHDMHQIQRFCDRALLLERGELTALGDSAEVAARYYELNYAKPAKQVTPQPALEESNADSAAELIDAWFQDGEGRRTNALDQGRPCAACARVRFEGATSEPVFTFAIADQHRRRVVEFDSGWAESETGVYEAGDIVDVAVSFDNWLAPGPYALQVGVAAGARVLARDESAAALSISGARPDAGAVEIPHQFHLMRHDRVAGPVSPS